jgi:hypothetical protein
MLVFKMWNFYSLPTLNAKLEDHPLSTDSDYFLNIFTAPYLEAITFIRSLRTHHAVVISDSIRGMWDYRAEFRKEIRVTHSTARTFREIKSLQIVDRQECFILFMLLKTLSVLQLYSI